MSIGVIEENKPEVLTLKPLGLTCGLSLARLSYSQSSVNEVPQLDVGHCLCVLECIDHCDRARAASCLA